MNELQNQIFHLYESKSVSSLCKGCEEIRINKYPEKNLCGPISLFGVGNNFESDKYKILFVGKNNWYQPDQIAELEHILNSHFGNATKGGRIMFEFDFPDQSAEKHSRRSAYWRCIREITKDLYPEEETSARWNRIAVTNLVKCNIFTGNSVDITPYDFSDKCLELLNEEIKILKPKHIILFWGTGYDEYLNRLECIGDCNLDKSCEKGMLKKNGDNMNVLWLQGQSPDGTIFLRTRHPQGAPKSFTKEIVNWIKLSNK